MDMHPWFFRLFPRMFEPKSIGSEIIQEPPSPSRVAGFTLVEMLVVIAIISILTGFVVQSMATRDSREFSGSLARIATQLGSARQTARSMNTYVYVGIRQPEAPENVMYMTMYSSTQGTDVLDQIIGGADISKMPEIMTQLARPEKLERIRIADSDKEDESKFTDIKRPAGGILINKAPSFLSRGKTFSHVFYFTPEGEARQTPAVQPILELAFEELRNKNNQAVVQVSGITGSVMVYQR
jgi:prepilin-type N-terminal cleavage/methylation domain-containing protein